ncbi:MAG: LPS export ABC transporter ATP-binding protein [bacterium]|nr:LPS export ABC transporter ATP-binding protein [bacterium]
MDSLHAQQLVKTYRSRRVVDGVDLVIEPGQIVGLLGPNGAGKTTIFHMIMGIIKPDSGAITLRGKDITHLPLHQRARAGLGFLSQEPSIFRKLTAEQNLLAILEFSDLSSNERRQKTNELLTELGLEHLSKNKAETLSGGERRRLEIARAMLGSPAFFLLDEPFLGVDPITVSEIQTLIQDLKNRGIGILITDHNVRDTLAITDRAYIIHQGKVLVAGNAEQLLNDEKAREIYLGEKFNII